MIYFCESDRVWKFDGGNDNIIISRSKLIVYNQLFIDDRLYVLNIKTGKLYINQVDSNMIMILKQYNFGICRDGRFSTCYKKRLYIYEIVLNIKTNKNWVINHIDGNISNNKISNLELTTQWFNIVLRKKISYLPIGIVYNNNASNFTTSINLPTLTQSISFSSKSIDYLQNIHYQFATKSCLVTPQRYLQSIQNWLPDNSIQFALVHQDKLNVLIEEHLKNQAKWNKPTILIQESNTLENFLF